MKISNWISFKQGIIAASIFLVGGCAPGFLGDIIKVDTPIGAQNQTVGGSPLPTKLSLNDSLRMHEAWRVEKSLFDSQWVAGNEEGMDTLGTWTLVFNDLTSPEQLIKFGLNPASGGASMGLYLLGLFTRRPRDKKLIDAAQQTVVSIDPSVKPKY